MSGRELFSGKLGHAELPASQHELLGTQVKISSLTPNRSISRFLDSQQIGAERAFGHQPMQFPIAQVGKPRLRDIARSLTEAEAELELESRGPARRAK